MPRKGPFSKARIPMDANVSWALSNIAGSTKGTLRTMDVAPCGSTLAQKKSRVPPSRAPALVKASVLRDFLNEKIAAQLIRTSGRMKKKIASEKPHAKPHQGLGCLTQEGNGGLFGGVSIFKSAQVIL